MEQEEDKTMDVTFVLEESGVTATVEVPCDANAAAAKEVACTALAVSPSSVEMRIGTKVLEGTCRLQDTAFDAGVQVVLARFADIKCPAEFSEDISKFALSPCGTLCLIFIQVNDELVTCVGFDTETFNTAFKFDFECDNLGRPAVSPCKTRCYVPYDEDLLEIALPSGKVRKVDGPSRGSECARSVFASGSVVVTSCDDFVSVYDTDLTLLRSVAIDEGSKGLSVSDCGGWMIFQHDDRKVRLQDVSTGVTVACVPVKGDGQCHTALSRSASIFAVGRPGEVQLYDWSGAALGSIKRGKQFVCFLCFTPCGKYLVVNFVKFAMDGLKGALYQYDVATMSCVRVIAKCISAVAISPTSRVVMFSSQKITASKNINALLTRHLYPYSDSATEGGEEDAEEDEDEDEDEEEDEDEKDEEDEDEEEESSEGSTPR